MDEPGAPARGGGRARRLVAQAPTAAPSPWPLCAPFVRRYRVLNTVVVEVVLPPSHGDETSLLMKWGVGRPLAAAQTGAKQQRAEIEHQQDQRRALGARSSTVGRQAGRNAPPPPNRR